MMYSLAETIEANGLKPFDYFKYLMYELMKYPRNNVPEDVLASLMPWSKIIPDDCRKKLTRKTKWPSLVDGLLFLAVASYSPFTSKAKQICSI